MMNFRNQISERQMPLSLWQKKTILLTIRDGIDNGAIHLNCSFALLKELKLTGLRYVCLSYSDWRQAPAYGRVTLLYRLDINKIERITNKYLYDFMNSVKTNVQHKYPDGRYCTCEYQNWTDTGYNNLVLRRVISDGHIVGQWFIPLDDDKNVKAILDPNFKIIDDTTEKTDAFMERKVFASCH